MRIGQIKNWSFYATNTKDWMQKCWLGIGRSYDELGELDELFIELFIVRIGVYLK